MDKSNIIIKNIKLTVSKDELDMIADAINAYLEDMETANDELSLRTIDVGRLNFYKVDNIICCIFYLSVCKWPFHPIGKS